jgi:hypothetical protein
MCVKIINREFFSGIIGGGEELGCTLKNIVSYYVTCVVWCKFSTFRRKGILLQGIRRWR